MTKLEIQAIENTFGQVESLPTLPTLAMDIITLAENPTSSLADMSVIIQKDPAIAGKILKIANSSFYGYSRNVNTLTKALLILGIREVKNIVLSVSIINLFPKPLGGMCFDHKRFWMHSAACAQIARSLAFKVGLYDLEAESFTAGLIHDIGKIVIDQFRPRDFLQILQLIQQKKLDFLEAERQILGVDHAQIGSWVAHKWQLPISLIGAIEYHHAPQNNQNSPLLSSLIHVADIFCKAKTLSLAEEFKGEAITDNIGWNLIKEKSSRNSLPLDIERFTFGLDEEISMAEQFINIARGGEV